MRYRHLSRFSYGLLTLVAVAISACSPIATQATRSIHEPDAVQSGRFPSDSRLLVMGLDGNIYTMDPNGTNTIALTDDASATTQYMQPSWSPNGEQIAWTETNLEDGEAQSSLVVADGAGESRSVYDVPYPPFYIDWSPKGDKLAYLSSWSSQGRPSMVLRLLDLTASQDEMRTLSEGQPFYLSWAPDGDSLLTHIQNERVEIQQIDGTRESINLSSASFPAPQWFPSSDKLLYAVTDNGDQNLIIADLEGNQVAEITDFDNNISFTLSPDESQIAYAVTAVSTGTAAFGPLYVFDLTLGSTREISSLPVIAFFWSPDAEKLAFLSVDQSESNFRFLWRVWDGSQIQDYDANLPTRTFLERYLTFFDQYAQSMTIWSPDSSAFTYAGIGQDNRSGIWVQELDSTSPRYLGPGVYSAWSPQ